MAKLAAFCIIIIGTLLVAITLAFTVANADSSINDGYYLGDESQDVEPKGGFKSGEIDGEIGIIPGDFSGIYSEESEPIGEFNEQP